VKRHRVRERETLIPLEHSSGPRQGCVSVAKSTRIRHAGIERAAVGAAATERWSVRGPEIATPPHAAEASELRQAG
jgi:hypothetical protein